MIWYLWHQIRFQIMKWRIIFQLLKPVISLFWECTIESHSLIIRQMFVLVNSSAKEESIVLEFLTMRRKFSSILISVNYIEFKRIKQSISWKKFQMLKMSDVLYLFKKKFKTKRMKMNIRRPWINSWLVLTILDSLMQSTWTNRLSYLIQMV